MYEKPRKVEPVRYAGPEELIRPPIAWKALALQWLVGLVMLAIGVSFLQVERAKQLQYERIMRDGVQTTALVDEAYVEDASGEGSSRCYLVVRFYTDGTAGPPRPKGSMFPDWGMPSMPGMEGMPGMGMGMPEPSMHTHAPPLPFDMEVSIQGRRIVGHPVCAGRKDVPPSYYEAAEAAKTVEVRYLQRDPSQFVLVNLPQRSNMWWVVMWMGIVGLAMAWRFWRTYVR